jgi:toxin ParE1/3/4
MRVFITPAAQSDIVEIGSWIAGDNPKRAVSFMLELKKACEKIGDAPKGQLLFSAMLILKFAEKPTAPI